MKSPVQYFGAKQQIAEQLVALMPSHMGYIEPYAGSLSVLLAKPESKIEVVNDLDSRLMTFWRVLRDSPEELLHVAEFTPHSRAELEGAAALDGETDLELARQVWVLLTQGRSRTMKRTGWRFYVDPRGTNGSFSTYMRAYRSRLLPAAERLQNVSLECRPALEVIDKYGAHEDNLLYVDPPYVHSSRRGARYTHEMTESDHRDMAGSLRACAATVMLSGYASELYDELFADWYQVQISARSDNAIDRDVVEVVWSNRPLGDFLWHEEVSA
ncbi:DNA adenine methylase [Microbacterium hydrocarbonoxydans]|uniref:DNA adenine methylase n=1 Tax=Microbacterium hydrocarbonoxydans TaxID=273678 RepID=A0A0M2HS32_9MICO|nr:DNA adenine methylase [Microbacterium hydrocarbonoxydans]KJL49511.1 DNA adenine methylase [Microbacterium hydrocarbonoxydans]